MIANDHELQVNQGHIARFQRWLMQIRQTTRSGEFEAVASGYRLEADAGNFRVGIDFDNRSGTDHPYRWGFGAPLAPGQAVTITGAIRLKNLQTHKYWAGLVQEYVAWIQDRQGAQTIAVS